MQLFQNKARVTISSHGVDPGICTDTSWIQFRYGVWANLTQLGIGLAFGFQPVTVAHILAKDSLMPSNVESWIATVISLSTPIGCVISGVTMDWRGRRSMLVLCQVPMFIGWFFTAFATTTTGIIIGRIITGVGCGMAIVPSRIYTTEICLPNMRGPVGIFPDIAIAIGITIQAGLDSVILWRTSCFMYGLFALVLLICNYFLPETPYYVLLKDSTDDVKQALAKFRSQSFDLDSEMNVLIDFKRDNTIRSLVGKEKLKELVNKSTCKPFVITTVYLIFAELSGVNIIMLWTIQVLAFSNSSMDLHEGHLILAFTRLIVSVFTSMLLFKIGKKPMALVSALGVGFTCIGLGTYLHYNEQPNIIPQMGYVAYIAFATLGYYTLPYLIMTELYSLQIRGFMAGISVAIASSIMFATNKYFPYLRDLLGLVYTLITFGVSSIFGSLFLYFYLPETKLLTLQDIEEYYNGRRPTLVSQRRVMSIQLRDATAGISKRMVKLSKARVLSRSHLKKKTNDDEEIEKRKKRLFRKKQITADDNEESESPQDKSFVTLGSDSDNETDIDSNK